MKWKLPPDIKVYEALGAVADGRVEVDGNTAKCFSSSGNKHYDVTYDPEANAIMANDNGSYWKGYLGYPSIAFLFEKRVLEYRNEYSELLKGLAWKNINQQFKNDFAKTKEHILADLEPEKRAELGTYVAELLKDIEALGLQKLGKRTRPPKGY